MILCKSILVHTYQKCGHSVSISGFCLVFGGTFSAEKFSCLSIMNLRDFIMNLSVSLHLTSVIVGPHFYGEISLLVMLCTNTTAIIAQTIFRHDIIQSKLKQIALTSNIFMLSQTDIGYLQWKNLHHLYQMLNFIREM